MTKPFAITLDVRTSLANHTGSWRTERPIYLQRQPPCNTGCPAGENIQGWLFDAEDGSYQAAWRRLVEINPFPAVMGRVCYHPCETACNRGHLDSPVGINSVERFLGDAAIAHGWTLDSPPVDTGHRVLVVGAGPAGLAAAYHLRRRGHAVEIREAGSQAGGMMRWGIPTFRLPRDVLDAELARLTALGIDLRLNTAVTDLVEESKEFDATFLAMGAQLSHRAYVPAAQSARIVDALELLERTSGGERPMLGRRVAVYGGGNTAMDAARTARRLGAEDAVVVYRRDREHMPANEVEVSEALAEGIRIQWLSTIKEFDGSRLTVERMQLDSEGRPQPTGELVELSEDAVVLAVGQEVDLGLIDDIPGVVTHNGVLSVDGGLMTGRPGLFAGGDLASPARSVTAAIGQGRAAALSIDAWLRSQPLVAEDVPERATFDKLNTWYFNDAPATVRPVLDAARRVSDFEEVVQGLSEETALYEARRCMSCGNCFGCDNCFGVCPDNAVIKLTGVANYAIDYDYCKGCGLCVAECPAGAIAMQPEPS